MSASPITDRYVARTPKSAALNEAAKRSMPGGDTRSTAWFAPYPPFVAEGGGRVLHRRGRQPLRRAPEQLHVADPRPRPPGGRRGDPEQLGRGASFAAPHEHTLRLAQMLCERVDSIERIRFANSGTEAVMMAVRVARAFTGRPLIAKAEGGYHGTWDDVQLSVAPPLDKAGPAERPTPVLDSPGLSPASTSRRV